MAELVSALPPVLRRGLYLGDPLALLERDLVVLARVVAADRYVSVIRSMRAGNEKTTHS